MPTDRSFFVPLDRLMVYEEFSTFEHGSKYDIFDFIQFFYHRDSPFAKDYENLEERAKVCVKETNLRDGDVWTIHLMSCGVETANHRATSEALMGEEESMVFNQIDDMIACYLTRIQHNTDWEAMMTIQMLAWEYGKKLRTPTSMLAEPDKELKAMEIKTKIMPAYLELPAKIKAFSEKIFGKNEKAAKVAEEKIARPTAESMASRHVKK